jgi:hypothetical protein
MAVGCFDQSMRLFTLIRNEGTQRETKYPVPEVRRPLPQDESKDRQVQREPNGQYHQYHHHEYLTVVSRLGFPDAGEPPGVHYLRDCFSCEDIPTGLSCSQAPLPPPQSGRSGAGATLSMRLAAALAGSRFFKGTQSGRRRWFGDGPVGCSPVKQWLLARRLRSASGLFVGTGTRPA